MPPIDGQVPAYVCKLMIGAVDPRSAYASSFPDLDKWDIPSVPVDGADRPVFYGKGPIRAYFGEQALQWSDICAAKDSLHYKIRQDSSEYTSSNMVRMYDPVSRLPGPIDLKSPADAPSVIDPSTPWTFSAVHDPHFQALHVDRADGSAVILSRASTPSVSEELYPLDDKMVLNLTGLPLASGTLVVHMPGRVAETGKPYALVNGERTDALVHLDSVMGLQNLGEGQGTHTTFEVQYAAESAGDAMLQIEIFPEIKDKHLYRTWDGSCYRYGGLPSDLGSVTVYNISTGMPACTSSGEAESIQKAGWGVARPADGSPIEVLTNVTVFDGIYMAPRPIDAPVITQEGDVAYRAVSPLQNVPPDFDLLDHDGLPASRIKVLEGQEARFLLRLNDPDDPHFSFSKIDSPGFIGGRCVMAYACGIDIPSTLMPGNYSFGYEFKDGKSSNNKRFVLEIISSSSTHDVSTPPSKPSVTVTDDQRRSVSEVTMQKARGYSEDNVSFFINTIGADGLRLEGAPPFIWLEDRGGGNYAMMMTTIFSTPRDYSFDIVAINGLGEVRKEFRLNLEDFPIPIYRNAPGGEWLG